MQEFEYECITYDEVASIQKDHLQKFGVSVSVANAILSCYHWMAYYVPCKNTFCLFRNLNDAQAFCDKL